MAQLHVRSVTCYMGSHSVTCYPTQVNTPRFNPSHTGRYSIYLPRRDGRLSWPSNVLCFWCERCRGCELVTAGDFNCNLDSTDPISRYLNEFIARFLADRTATQYDWLLASSCCPSVCLWRCALWLSVSVHRTKSCTSVFLAGMFLFVVSDTFAVGCIV